MTTTTPRKIIGYSGDGPYGLEYAPETCGWLMQVPSGNPEPDFPGDCWSLVTCDGIVPPRSDRCLCEYHLAALNLPEAEFDRISEQHGGRAWS